MVPKYIKLCLLIVLFSVVFSVNAETDSFVGIFNSGSSVVGYNSAIPYTPGNVTFPILLPISGIEKFDPSLGALTDIRISVSEADPIYYDIVGSLTAIRTQSEPQAFSGFVSPINANVGVFYQAPSGVIIEVLTEMASTALAGCSGSGSESSCGLDPIYANDFFLNGDASLAGSAGLSPFIGTGDVDSLYFGLNIQSSAEFLLENASANMQLYIDTFGSDTSLIFEYEYTPVPIPPTIVLFALIISILLRRGRCEQLAIA